MILSSVMNLRECFQNYSSAGVLVTTRDKTSVLLGSHKVGMESLWGNFAGGREPGETDPRVTASRELEEELGLQIAPEALPEPLVVVDERHGNRQPITGIIYRIGIDKRDFHVEAGGEIEKTQWFTWDGIMRLMDEYRPDLRLWGGIYTAEALNLWTKIAHHPDKDLAGVITLKYIYTPPHTLYEKLKEEERKNKSR